MIQPKVALTTVDNPFNPLLQFDEWYQWDRQMGYNTSDFLARIVMTSDELSESDQNFAIETAIDEILLENVSGLYKKVTQSQPSKDVSE